MESSKPEEHWEPASDLPPHQHPHYIRVRAIAGYFLVMGLGLAYIITIIMNLGVPWSASYGPGCSITAWNEVNSSAQALSHFFWNPSQVLNASYVGGYEYGVCLNLTQHQHYANVSWNGTFNAP